MDIKELELLIADFEWTAKIAKEELSVALDYVSTSKAPESEQINKLSASLAQLQEKYSFIRSRARELVGENEMPVEAIPVHGYIGIVLAYGTRKVKEKVDSAERIINIFISVKSAIEGYANALEPLQKEASEVLSKHINGKLTADELIEAAILPGLFVEAVEINNIDSDRGMDLIDKIGEHYPKRVMAGVAAQKYHVFVDEIKVSNSVSEDEKLIENELVLEQMFTPNKVTGHGTIELEVQEENTVFEMESVLERQAVAEDKSVEETLAACNKPKNNAANASSFKGELQKLPPVANKILAFFTNLGALTERQIYIYGVCMDCFNDEDGEAREKLSGLINQLTNKGLLASYEIDDEGTKAYCLSKFAHGCLCKESIIHLLKQWNISLGKSEFYGEETISKDKLLKMITHNARLLTYIDGARKLVDQGTYSLVKSSIKWQEDHYIVNAYGKEEPMLAELVVDEERLKTTKADLILWIDNLPSETAKFGTETGKFFNFNNGKMNYYDIVNGKIKVEMIAEDVDSIPTTKTVDNHFADPVEETVASFEATAVESLEEEIDALTHVHSNMTDEELYTYIKEMLNRKEDNAGRRKELVAEATLLAKATSFEKGYDKCKQLYAQLLMATAIPLDECHYTSTNISEVFQTDQPESLQLAAQMYAMVVPGMAYDYPLKSMSDTYLRDFELYFPSCGKLKELFSKLMHIWNVAPTGYTSSVIARLGDDAENQKFVSGLEKEAIDLLTLPNIKTRIKTLRNMYVVCFGQNSMLYMCMSIISQGKSEDVEFVKDVLHEYCNVVDGEYNISNSKIESELDRKWDDVNPGNNFPLDYDARAQVLKQFNSRLTLMKTWIEHIDSAGSNGSDISKLKTLKDDIVAMSHKVLDSFDELDIENANVLYWMVDHICTYVSGEFDSRKIYSSLLYTGRVSLDKSFMPILDGSLSGVMYCEPWRSVLGHIEAEKKSLHELIEAIEDKDSAIFDNLNQLRLLGLVSEGDLEEFAIGEIREKTAVKAAEARTTKFKERLELAYTYDQITENEKETLAAIMEQQKERFFTIEDFGCWKQFIEGLERQIYEMALSGQKALKKKIASRLEKDPESSILKEASILLDRDTNLAVTEEYLNRYDAGEKEISIQMENFLQPRNDFSNFLSEEVYNPILSFAKRMTDKALKYCGWSFISGRLPADWTSRLKDDSKKLIDNWPASKTFTTTAQIENLFKGLGFNVNAVTLLKGTREETFQLELQQTPRSMADYTHPISAFGTQMKLKMNVIVLYGNHTPGQIVEAVSSADAKGFSVVLLDRPLEIVVRRQIGELSHQKSGQNPFILIDWVLIMFLAMQDNTKRLPLMLTCTLPYTIYQPFVRDGGPTADEMFCGRTRELNTIMDPNGASIVYGGRQLGKTALLERAASRCHRPENKEFAIFCSIIGKTTESKVAELISEKIKVKTDLEIKPCTSLKELSEQIEGLFDEKKVSSFLLLLDECDDFLGAISGEAYKPIQAMIDLKRSTKNAFKFVLAGLHNVCRAKNSTERNGVFGQLGEPLCVKPLSPTDALQLLSKPLSYLGFQINPYPHLKTILTKTNYYPGILQFFGYKLLETLTDQYSKYYSAANGNPPFSLKDEQLGAVLSSADLNNSIKAKFRWSLELDQRYFMIARCITMLYHFEVEEQSGSWKGFSTEQIKKMAEDYDIYCLKNINHSEYMNLLDEMVDMGILSKLEGETYRLRRSSFIDIIGADIDALDKDIIENNQEVRA